MSALGEVVESVVVEEISCNFEKKVREIVVCGAKVAGGRGWLALGGKSMWLGSAWHSADKIGLCK